MTEALKSALKSILANKIRSILTVLGIVIGVASVTILVSLGQGLKDQVSGLIRGFGSNVIFVTSGKISDSKGGMTQINPSNLIATDIIKLSDVETVKEIKGIKHITPMALVSGNLKYEQNSSSPMLVGIYSNFIEAFDIFKFKEGGVFSKDSSDNVIILGPVVKKELFGDVSAVGKTVNLKDKEFKVIGVLDQATGTSLVSGEYDKMSMIPFNTATILNNNQIKINRLVIRTDDNAKVGEMKDRVKEAILKNHKGEEDFSVLTQDDLVGLFDQFLGLATALVSAIAAISLVVGGIGIMNIMLVTVTERTKEIGLRKAVGATKLDIARQFLIESIMITLVGGIIGLLISFGVGFAVASKTPLAPLISIDIIFIALGVSFVVGIVFGLWPALRAANKDPIEALRYE